jgi:hypothetical protein
MTYLTRVANWKRLCQWSTGGDAERISGFTYHLSAEGPARTVGSILRAASKQTE